MTRFTHRGKKQTCCLPFFIFFSTLPFDRLLARPSRDNDGEGIGDFLFFFFFKRRAIKLYSTHREGRGKKKERIEQPSNENVENPPECIL